MIRCIVAGGRDFNNYDLLKSKLDIILSSCNDIEIVSGGCTGADRLGELYASEHNIPVKVFSANWALGKAAGPIRNRQMAEYATHSVIFWDGRSRGSKNMIDLSREYNLKNRIIYY